MTLTATSIQTGSRNDTIVVAGGGDAPLDAGSGTDTIEIQATKNIDLSDPQAAVGAGTYALSNFEKAHIVWLSTASSGGTVDARPWSRPIRYENWSSRKVTFLGGSGPDHASGGQAGDTLKGFDGNDTLKGRKGPDTLRGGPGTDYCDGGDGADDVATCEKGPG